jgi:hypothetical protein
MYSRVHHAQQITRSVLRDHAPICRRAIESVTVRSFNCVGQRFAPRLIAHISKYVCDIGRQRPYRLNCRAQIDRARRTRHRRVAFGLESVRVEATRSRVAVVDVHDTPALTRVFRDGRRLFLLNPPAAPSTDTAREERKSVASILRALDESKIEKVVAESAYGAQPGEHVGDLGVLFELEQQLNQRSIPSSIIRAAYYMSNWDSAAEVRT